ERTELELTLPDHAPDIGELRELAERHPFRQRLAGQLMTALHRSGRTPEALEVYELLQRRLDQDLGLDPETRLAELRTEILRDNAKNDAPTPQAPPRAAPEQLPADPTALVGRDDQLSTLDQLLYNGRTTAVVSAIDGAGGVGKTALAVHWAHQVRQHFPEGQLYLDLRGYDAAEPVTPADALATLLHALGQPDSTIPANLDDAAAMYRSLLADRHMLVLLDNAREAAQVRPLLPGGTGNFALVTSRDSLASLIALDDAVPVRVDTLGPNESIALIADVVGASRVEAAGDAAARLAEVCGHLPLALRIAAAHLAAHPNAPLSTMAADIARRANERDAVAAVCDIAVAALGPADRALLAALTAVPDEDFAAEATLGRLIAAHLVEHHRPGRCRLHDLVRGAVTRRAAVLRHCGQTAGTGLSDR
ncbi:MAG TPA: BTAD domain-containing putative transcriptional regulator, partial [Stackebrandtia sp.]|uniref:BTAD domain-containing putative transcriptional regulator n=1 Tax=Stackebrandtia sp. TaxID=2023065 RepID=UPI002D382743